MALRSRLLVQIPVGLKFAELFMTESSKMVKESGIFEEVRPFITFVLGGPGSGKGTQCAKIAEEFGFAHLSAGELLRKQISSGCENGAMILDIIKEGRIVPSDITVNLIRREIELSKSRKILVDGFPRTNENRIAFEQIMGVEPDMVIFFDCSKEEMVKRLLSRNQVACYIPYAIYNFFKAGVKHPSHCAKHPYRLHRIPIFLSSQYFTIKLQRT